jgi:HK97 family phage prohead protease
MDQIMFKAIPGQINIDEAKGIVECFVAGIGNKDSVGDIIVPGAFTESLKRRKPRVVWGHDWNHPIGKVIEIYEVPASDSRLPSKMKQAGIGGLFARLQFNLKSEKGKEAFTTVAFYGEEQEYSIGYKTLDAVYDNERKANILRELELYEVSPVLHGANQLTGTISIKSEQADRVSSFKKSEWPMFDRAFAERIKNDYPEIWNKGGNIKGDDQYEILSRIAEQGGVAKTEDQIKALELREAWIARHHKNFLLAGVVAQIKWLAIGSRGESHMKKTVNDAISAMKSGEKSLDNLWEDEVEEKGYGKPGKEKLSALIEAVLKAADMDDDEVESIDDMEEKDRMWMLRRLLGMSPRDSYGGGTSRYDEDDDDRFSRLKPSMMPQRGGYSCSCGKEADGEVDMDDNEEMTDEAKAVANMLEAFTMNARKRNRSGSGMKSLEEKFAYAEFKAGRVLSTSNMQKIRQAIQMLQEVMAAGGREDIEQKVKHLFIDADIEEVFGVKDLIDPILDFYNLDAEVREDGVLVKNASTVVESAVNSALSHYFSGAIEYKGAGKQVSEHARWVD